jgi:hypothetical protein
VRSWLIGLCCALIIGTPGATLPVPVRAVVQPIPLTPRCPQPQYATTAALLAALAQADYICAEEVALALRSQADPALVASLLERTIDPAYDTRARRNALRTLGRFAEAPPHSRAAMITLHQFGAQLQATATAQLSHARDSFILQDAIWLLDRFFFPSPQAAPALAQLAADPALDPLVRTRAANARARLVWSEGPALAPTTLEFLTTGLQSTSPGVRAAAADAIARLRSEQLPPDRHALFQQMIAAAWANEPPLQVAAEPPAERNVLLSGLQESAPTPLSARAALARAHDRLNPGAQYSALLHDDYVTLALPYQQAQECVQIRAGIDPATLPDLLQRINLVERAFGDLVGAANNVPLAPGDCTIRVWIFATRSAFREYMRAFTPFSVDVDGIYAASSATLYTHQRTAQQSENSLIATIQHEVTHHLTAQRLFPGNWNDPGYHREPKGWADEGLAELLAGLEPQDDGYVLLPRPHQLARLCARHVPPPLDDLLARRAGYDQFGSFDYEAAWALSYYLYTAQPAAWAQLAAAFRTEAYRLSAWEQSVGVPDRSTFAADWHTAIGEWCRTDTASQ